MLGAVLFVVNYAWPVLDPTLNAGVATFLYVSAGITWLLFVVDYAVRLWLSRDRRTFLRSHKLDLASVLLPTLRPLRLLTMIKVLNRRAGPFLRGKVTAVMVVVAIMLLFLSSVAVLDAERGQQGANIETFGDALWWAMATMITVGYGDLYPVTTEGRLVGVVLMVTGIGIIGVVSATFASWLIDRVHQLQRENSPSGEQPAREEDLHTMTDEITKLREEVRRLRADAEILAAQNSKRSP